MSWADERMLALDTETSGVDVENDRIVTACIAWVGAGAEPVIRHWLVAVDIDIPQGATDVHGISTEHAREHGVSARAALEGVLAELEAAISQSVPFVGMNMSFDLTLLDREWRRWHGEPLPVIPRPCVDPMVIDRALDKYRKGKRTLGDLCAHYKVNLDGAHAADQDALGAARLAWRMARVYPDQVGAVSLEDLHNLQVGWRREWAVGFREYLQRQGKPADDVDGSWPLRPFVEPVEQVAS